MLCWMKNYYTGETLQHPEKIQQKIDAGKPVPGIYLLTLSVNPGNVLEILPASMLMQKSLAAICPPIVGMELGKRRAVKMAAGILEELYFKTGGFALEEFMKNR